MRKTIILLALAAQAMTAASPLAAADAPQAPALKGYDAFHFTKLRNIFDPDRRPMRTENSAPPVTSSRPDHIALTGTMVTPGKALAFFNGSRSDYNRVIPIGEKIADCTLTAISSTQVELMRGGKAITMEVGKQMTLDEQSKISAASDTPAMVAPDTSHAAAAAAPESAPPPSGDKAEILRRMMERRQKEMK